MSSQMWIYISTPQILLLLSIFVISIISNVVGTIATSNLRFINGSDSSAPIFIFGDSTVDSGNNNYILTIAKANFPPYGRDFPDHVATGRFSNGRLVTDFIASYMGVKENVPPYLDPSLTIEELTTGVSFASGGTGYDSLTAKSNGNVISVERQLEYFSEYKRRLEKAIGKEKTKQIVSKGAFFISCGTNDLNNYFGVASLRRQQYPTPSAYVLLLMQIVQNFVQGLIEEGAQRIGVVGLPPIGCLPTVITSNSDNPLFHRHCLDKYSSTAREYNQMLHNTLKTMQGHGQRLVYFDIYKPLQDMIQNPTNYGYIEVNRGCCGSGLFELSVLCNPHSIVCSDASKYMFWDAVHPTQATCYHLFKALHSTIDYFLKPI